MFKLGRQLTLLTAAFQMQMSAFAAEDFAAVTISESGEQALLFNDIPSVYSASKYEQKVTQAPASISIVTADEIKKWGYRNFSDVISSLRGFYNTNDRSYGHAGARGYGSQTDYNNRLLLLIDGHRFNDNLYEGFDTTGAFPVELDDMERIEVVRGPSSSLYGNSAFFGVINIITKRGRDQHGASVRASYGTNNAYKTTFSYGDRFKNGLEAYLSGSFYNSDGFNKLYFKEFDDPLTNNGVSVGHDGEQTKKLLAKLAFGDFALEALYSNRSKDVPTADFGSIFNADGFNTANQYTFVELKYDHTFENKLNIQSRLSYNNTRLNGRYPYDLTSNGKPDLIINRDLANGQWLRAELEATKLLWQDHRITIGGQFQNNFQQFQTYYNAQETFISANDNTYQFAAFVQDDYSITQQLAFNVGLRFDYYSIFGSTLNPRLGLIYSPWQSTTFKILYGSAFRAPNQYELNYYGGTTASEFLRPNIQPERLKTTELIVEHYFTNQLRAEVNLFYTEISDIIQLVTLGEGVLINKNNANVTSKGIELQLENNWLNGWQGRISYTLQETTNDSTNQRVLNSPEHLLKFNLIAPLWHDKVFLGIETQYVGDREFLVKPLNNTNEMHGYVLTNVTLFSQKWLKGLELSGGVYNLFDQRYFDPAPSTATQNVIQQDALTFRIKASLDF